jgi:hypothetical protein
MSNRRYSTLIFELVAAFALPYHQRWPAREFSPPWALKLEPATAAPANWKIF